MILPIIESMKDSPEEMNRKRYLVFLDLIAELVACQNELQACLEHLEAIRRVLGLSGAESRPLALYVSDLIKKLDSLSDQASLDNQRFISKPFPSDHYGL